jgi:hypothetical protein
MWTDLSQVLFSLCLFLGSLVAFCRQRELFSLIMLISSVILALFTTLAWWMFAERSSKIGEAFAVIPVSAIATACMVTFGVAFVFFCLRRRTRKAAGGLTHI